MTPKEKAEELFDKYTRFQNGYGYEYKVKQCALIAVDELIKENESIENIVNGGLNKQYWESVKHEINNL
jgi:hypothetical protein